MSARVLSAWAAASAAIVLCGLGSGCKVAVDLTTPETVFLGRPADFKVSATNTSQCPVGDVKVLVFPFIPKDTYLNQLADPPREELRPLVEAFCTGRPVDAPPDTNARCTIAGGDVLCTLDRSSGQQGPAVSPSEAVLPPPSSAGEVTCAGASDSITCRIPQAMLNTAATASTSNGGPLLCQSVSGPPALGQVCSAATIPAGATATGQFQLVPDQLGVLRNWTVALAFDAVGVCTYTAGGTPYQPCSTAADCPGGADCRIRICVGGSRDGFGCFLSSSCSDGGTCVSCGSGTSDGEILASIACTTMNAFKPSAAPTMSVWGLVALAGALFGVGVGVLRRRRWR